LLIGAAHFYPSFFWCGVKLVVFIISAIGYLFFFFQIQSFITQDSGDRDLLVKHLQFFDVPILNYTGDGGHQREPFEISEDVSLVWGIFFINLHLINLNIYVFCYFIIQTETCSWHILPAGSNF